MGSIWHKWEDIPTGTSLVRRDWLWGKQSSVIPEVKSPSWNAVVYRIIFKNLSHKLHVPAELDDEYKQKWFILWMFFTGRGISFPAFVLKLREGETATSEALPAL